jgi:hypothetical protein
MTMWNHDITAAPLDRRLWLATRCDKVSVTRWNEKRGAWDGLATGEQPIAWQDYVVPVHPNLQEAANETMGGTGDDCSFGNRGVWPPQGGASSSRGNDSLSVVTAGETATHFILDDVGGSI